MHLKHLTECCPRRGGLSLSGLSFLTLIHFHVNNLVSVGSQNDIFLLHLNSFSIQVSRHLLNSYCVLVLGMQSQKWKTFSCLRGLFHRCGTQYVCRSLEEEVSNVSQEVGGRQEEQRLHAGAELSLKGGAGF